VSAAYRQSVEARLGGPIEVSILSDLRRAGLVALVRGLLVVRASLGLVLMEDASLMPVLPVLRVILVLTRCRSLALATPDFTIRPFGRTTGLLDILRLAAGSLVGVAAAARCAMELGWLARQPPMRVKVAALRRAVYLKTNLWFGIKAGGSVGHVAGVVNALVRRCAVDLFAVERPPLLAPEVVHHIVAQAGAFGYPYELNYYRYQRLFTRAVPVAPPRPDIVYHRISLANYAGVTVARRLAVPLVVEYNGSEVWVSKHWGRPLLFPRLAERAEHVALRHADLIVTVSEVLRDELVDKGISPERVLVHPNCIDPELFDPSAFSCANRRGLLERFNIPATATVCGFVGTFGAWHGVTVLAEAIRTLCLAHADWVFARDVRFLIVGDGLLMPRVREILADVPPDRVVLTGLVPQHEAPAYLAAAQVLLSPHVANADGSRFFGSPTKLFEYMAMARGIVASDLDQIGDVLRHSYHASALPTAPCPSDEDRLAVLAAPGSVDELIAGLRFLVDRDDYRTALGRNARAEVLRHYTWQRNVDELLGRLTQLNQPAERDHAHV
jgi:glycosyltransferase involved in cell wall biosynthesis